MGATNGIRRPLVLPFQGEGETRRAYPGRCPGLECCCPFRAKCQCESTAEGSNFMQDHALKDYQRDSLERLAQFCDEVRRSPRKVHDAFHAVTGRNFIDVPQMPGIPYVC